MTNNLATIRAALELAREIVPPMFATHAKFDDALAALAELERAAPEKSGSEAWLARYTAPPPAQPAMGMPEWYGMDTPWPLHDVLAKLIDATGVLLDRHSYDDHGHEGVRYAQLAGKEILANIFKDRTQ